MKTRFKQIFIVASVLFAFVCVLQASAGFSGNKKFNEQAPVEGCRLTQILTDVCIKAPKSVLGCVNTLDSASWSCTTATPPAEP